MTNSYDNYLRIQEHIVEIAQDCGRNPADISLIAVSKGFSLEQVLPVYDAGCRDLGESRIQEAMPKISNAPADIRWHLVGTLQKNKVRKALSHFALIHSVDSPDLAQKISETSQELEVVTRILLEVNISGERSKKGLTAECWKSSYESLCQLPAVRIVGLMTIAPLVDDEVIIRNCFEGLRLFRDELAESTGTESTLKHLSMGMSHDYPYAIAEGATLLRIGSAIFES